MKHIKRVSQAPTQLVLPILKNLGVSQEKQKKKSSRLFNKKITKTFKKKKTRGTKSGKKGNKKHKKNEAPNSGNFIRCVVANNYIDISLYRYQTLSTGILLLRSYP